MLNTNIYNDKTIVKGMFTVFLWAMFFFEKESILSFITW